MEKLALIAALATWHTAAADPAVWHIQPRPETDLWVLGSVHYLREQDHPLPEIVAELYSRADTLVMEIDLDDLDPSSVQMRFMQAAMLPSPMALSGIVSDELYAATAATAAALGLDMQTLEPFEPWFVALTLMDLGMARVGFRADQGLEQHLLLLAAKDQKPVIGLESLADQLNVFDSLPNREQQALLTQTLAELDTAQTEMDQLMTAWRDGRLDMLSQELLRSFDDFPVLYRALVVERNERWLGEIERLAARPGKYLIVVGALHLVGEGNVIDLLGTHGLRAVRMTY